MPLKNLINLGYQVTTQVSMSGYRIDQTIVDPNITSRYILGIECNGGMQPIWSNGESGNGNGIQESHASHSDHQEECKWDARK
ncbi:hypothetical protein [Bacillus sp. FJAT-27251]|uniref:hypothetical protein n=1 Tax=Bacillus sp. FJAT-27251 TaxID=1684142 RepID=UPI00336ABF1B